MTHSQNRWGRIQQTAWLVGIVCAALLIRQPLYGYTDPGLKLELAVDSEHADLTYTLGTEPISLFVSISNAEGRPIATTRGFSQIELYNTLVVTDPNGIRHLTGSEKPGHKMLPPYFINNLPWGSAEMLPVDWARSATIYDLTEKIPVMKTTAGWYTIETWITFARFAMTGLNQRLGLIARLDHPDNWTGKLAAPKLQIYIAPARGAKLKIQVLESKSGVLNPVAQVPVKVFSETGDENFNAMCDVNQDGFVNQSDLQSFSNLFGTHTAVEGAVDTDQDGDSDGADLAAFVKTFGSSGPIPQNLWEGTTPLLTGTTNFEGWTVWQTELACLPEDNYTAVAQHAGIFSQSSVAPGDASGWKTSCDNSIIRKISFGALPASATGDLNGDGCVDLNDYNQLVDELKEPAPHDPIFDLNNDGVVTIADARYLVVNFTNPKGAPCN